MILTVSQSSGAGGMETEFGEGAPVAQADPRSLVATGADHGEEMHVEDMMEDL